MSALLRTLLNTHKWIEPRLIPNRPGYKFVARLHDGRQIYCETFRREFAIRVSVRSEEKSDLKFDDIDVWKEL